MYFRVIFLTIVVVLYLFGGTTRCSEMQISMKAMDDSKSTLTVNYFVESKVVHVHLSDPNKPWEFNNDYRVGMFEIQESYYLVRLATTNDGSLDAWDSLASDPDLPKIQVGDVICFIVASPDGKKIYKQYLFTVTDLSP
jgi:hypothetical protein